jgi:phosphoserine aminotransferase
MKRVCNFGPGPSALPLAALQEAAEEFLNIKDTGKSVLETSHRSPEYDEIHSEVQQLVKELLGIGDEYKVLLLGGGASMQFAMLPLNLRKPGQTADYIITGSWAKKAAKEAKVLGDTKIAADTGKDDLFTRVPLTADCSYSANPAYVHLTTNNTIVGVQYHELPDSPSPLVADMSSDFLSRPTDVSRYGLFYAGAQKNIGPSGVAVVVIHDEVLDRCREDIPAMLSYKVHAEKRSLYNTPPCFNIYMTGKVLKWIKSNGGLAGMGERSTHKAQCIYGVVDQNEGFYRAPVERESRSQMNVVFRLPTEALEKRFVSEAKENGMIGLKGHRSVGGIRVSLYNGVEPEWAEQLAEFMKEFVRTHG